MQLIYIIIHNIPYLLTWFLASSLSLTLESLFFTPTHQQILKCEDRPLIYEIFHCSITLKSSPGVRTVTSVTADPSRGLRRASTHTHTHTSWAVLEAAGCEKKKKIKALAVCVWPRSSLLTCSALFAVILSSSAWCGALDQTVLPAVLLIVFKQLVNPHPQKKKTSKKHCK